MLAVENVRKVYEKNGASVAAVDGVSFEASAGEIVILHGPSGSGKSTLLLMLGAMMRPTSGKVRYDGNDLYAMSRVRRNRFRRQQAGFLFQRFYLMPYLSVYDNIRLPLRLQGEGNGVRGRIEQVAQRLGIESRLGHKPAELSVGEQQRAAMARTLAAGPGLILADEPTGNLDRVNARIIADCLTEERERGRLIIIATHDADLLSLGDRKLHLNSGRLT